MNDPLLMGVLHRVADRYEQFQALANRVLVIIAVLDNCKSLYQFHDEIRPTSFGHSSVEHFGNVGMIHHR
jgi:hypothetical protein